jgi:hypothetical protein
MTFHHARLEASLRHVLATLRLEGPAAAQSSFDTFRRELDAHLEAEERWLLPPFERAKPVAGEAVRAQHVLVRSGVARAASVLATRSADEKPFHELDELLARHCRDEEGDLYRFSETAIGEAESRAVLQKIEAVELTENQHMGP